MSARLRFLAPPLSLLFLAGFMACKGRSGGTPAAPVNVAATITTQPASQTVVAPATATFTVVAAGTPAPTYQWKLGGTAIAGATGASYTTAATDPTMNGNSYTVTVGNGVGTAVTSSPAILTVNSAPVITTQPTAQTVAVGAPLSLTVAATGNPSTFTYQWYLGGTAIAGATAATYSVAAAALTDAGNYYVTVANTIGTPAQSATVAVAVVAPFSVSGAVTQATGGAAVPGVTVTLNTSTPQTATTDATGAFTFPLVPPGTYTLTPSLSGPSTAFMPATVPVTVAAANVVNDNFQVALGYKVTGTAAYAGAVQKPIDLTLTGNMGATYATHITAPGAFTIQGVVPDTYTLTATMDTAGTGIGLADAPTVTMAGLTVNGADLAGVVATLVDGAPVTALAAPSIQVSPCAAGVAISYSDPNVNNAGEYQADSYVVEWSTDGAFPAGFASATFKADGRNVFFLVNNPGLAANASYYFRMKAVRSYATPVVSPYSAALNPVTIAAGTGANTVSGTITFAATPTGPLIAGIFDQSTGIAYGTVVTNPVSPQAYSVSGVPTSTATSQYFLFAILDQDKNGQIGVGDITNTNLGQDKTNFPVTGDVTGADVTLTAAGSRPSLATTHDQNVGGGGDSYGLDIQFRDGTDQVASTTLVAGPGIPVPANLGYLDNNGATIFASLGGTPPNVGDSYNFNVTYGNGTAADTFNLPVAVVLNAFPQNPAAPANHTSDLTPTFTWAAPAAPPASYTYQFSIGLTSGGGPLWQVPSQGGSGLGLASTATSLTYGADPTDPNNNHAPGLATGTSYTWRLSVRDAAGNVCTSVGSYQP